VAVGLVGLKYGDILILKTRCLSGKAARVHRPSRRRGGHLAARYEAKREPELLAGKMRLRASPR
jgi:hypothetical protein